MPGQRISDLPAGTPPYSTSSLLEVSVPVGAGAFDTRKALLSDLIPTSGVVSVIPGYLAVGQDTPVNVNRARMQITIPSANTTQAIFFNTNDWVFGSAGSSFQIGFGGFTGNTHVTMLAMMNGNSAYGRLALQVGDGYIGIGNSTGSLTAKVTIFAPSTAAEALELRNNNSGSSIKFSFGANSGNTYSILSAFVAGNTAPGNLVLNATAIGLGAPPSSAGRLQVQAESGNSSIAQFQTGDWASGTTGTSLYMGFLAGSGNTRVILNVFNAGNTTPGNLLLNTNGGSVGIGTTAPGALLDIKTPGGPDRRLQVRDDPSNMQMRAANDASNAYVPLTIDAGPLCLNNSSNGNTNNVGIGGMPDVNFKLDIIQGTRTGFQISSTANVLQFWKDIGASSACSIGMNIPAYPITNDMIFSTYATGWAERMRITQGGNVNVGTASGPCLLNIGSTTTPGIVGLYAPSSTAYTPVIDMAEGGNYFNRFQICRHTDIANFWAVKTIAGDQSVGMFVNNNASMGIFILGGTGAVGVGTVTPICALHVNSHAGGGTGVGNQFNVTNSDNTWGVMLGFDGPGVGVAAYHGPNQAYLVNVNSGSLVFGTSNLLRGYFDPGGAFYIVGGGYKPGGGVWGDSSDIRTKEDIADYTQGLAAVTQLKPISYKKNGKGGTTRDGKTYIGLIANQAREVMPEMVGVVLEKYDPEDDDITEILTLDATALIYALVNSVKELKSELDELKASRG